LNKRTLDFGVLKSANTRLVFLDKQADSDLCGNLKTLHNKHVIRVKLLEKKKLNEKSCESPTTLLIRLETDAEEFEYEPGDHIAIYPQNQKDHVEFILSRLDNVPCFDKQIQIQCLNERNEWTRSHKFPIECSIREAFTFYLDISNSLTQTTFSGLSQQAQSQSDQLRLKRLANVWNLYEK
jgi:sulfite reductase alpha subunit-like flavoprotein